MRQQYSQQSRGSAGRPDASWPEQGIGPHSTLRRRSPTGGTVAVIDEPRPKRIRLLLIEDNRLLRDAIANMLHRHADLQVVTAAVGIDAHNERSSRHDHPPFNFSTKSLYFHGQEIRSMLVSELKTTLIS